MHIINQENKKVKTKNKTPTFEEDNKFDTG